MPRRPNEPIPAGAVGLRLNLSPADRDRLMVVAARAGVSMATYLRRLVLKDLDRREPAVPGR